MNEDEHISHIVQQSGLEEDTCRELLEKGWTFVRSLDEPSRWVDPRAKLPNYTPHKEPICQQECGYDTPHYHGFPCSTNCVCNGVCHPDCPAYQKNGAQYA